MANRSPTTAAHRFGLGPKPGEFDRIGSKPEAWLLAQLETPYRAPHQFEGFLSTADQRRSMFHRYTDVTPRLREQREAAQARGDQAEAETLSAEMKRVEFGYLTWMNESMMLEFGAQTNVAITTDEPFRERLVRFWCNHLVVPAIKQPSKRLAAAYEREAIRPHVTGKFADMLVATAKHPGMLVFLDNILSMGSNSSYGQTTSRGINENLGREILELHTMGVLGGYTQSDVIELSKGISGWSLWPLTEDTHGSWRDRPPGARYGEFHFYADWHEPGSPVMLGKSYDQPGLAKGEAMLNDLARRPETARFLATKLAQHFVSDAPGDDIVRRLADAYLAHDTDLGEMARALVQADEPWDMAGSKLKQPQDFVLSVLRVLGKPLLNNQVWPQTLYDADTYRWREHIWALYYDDEFGTVPVKDPADYASDMAKKGLEIATLYRDIAAMGQPPFRAPGPQGWYDRWSDWNGSDSILKRAEFGAAKAELFANDIGDPMAFLNRIYPAHAPDDLASAVKRAASGAQAISLILSSPQFQRR